MARGSYLKLASADGSSPRSPERQALADAIEHLAQIDRDIFDAEAAKAKAHEHRVSAEDRLAELRSRAPTSAGDLARSYVEALNSGALIPDAAPGGDAEALRLADADIVRWNDVISSLRIRIAELDLAASHARLGLGRAARRVMGSEAPIAALTERIEACKTQLAEDLAILGSILSDCDGLDDHVKAAANHAILGELPRERGGRDEWRAAIRALETDADAPLPEI